MTIYQALIECSALTFLYKFLLNFFMITQLNFISIIKVKHKHQFTLIHTYEILVSGTLSISQIPHNIKYFIKSSHAIISSCFECRKAKILFSSKYLSGNKTKSSFCHSTNTNGNTYVYRFKCHALNSYTKTTTNILLQHENNLRQHFHHIQQMFP